MFKHTLVRDVAYESVLRTRRQRDHARIARWLVDATQLSGRADEYAGLIAGHHEQAGEDVAAAAWYLRAGRHAAKVFANADALALLGKALATARPVTMPCGSTCSPSARACSTGSVTGPRKRPTSTPWPSS